MTKNTQNNLEQVGILIDEATEATQETVETSDKKKQINEQVILIDAPSLGE